MMDKKDLRKKIIFDFKFSNKTSPFLSNIDVFISSSIHIVSFLLILNLNYDYLNKKIIKTIYLLILVSLNTP
jgi:hypothetical protein